MNVRTFFPLIFAVTANADTLQHADLEKLRDPARREAEVSRLAGCDGGKQILTQYRFLTANQKDGRPPLHVLCAAYDYISTIDPGDFGGYKLEKPEEIFGEAAHEIAVRTEPSLDPVRDSLLLIFNSTGKEVRPFGGNNYTDEGYYFDFDHDGILDRADSTNYGLEEAPKHSVQVFELQSIEPKPRTLLEVIFNWHPDSADDANNWAFTCFDDNQDGFIEIGFGPESATTEEEQRRFVFRWDPATEQYSAGEIPEHAHIRVMKSGESLSSIANAGGLDYPLIKDPSEPQTDGPTLPSSQARYAFRSLKDRPDTELAAFFQGKPRRSSWDGPEDSFPNRLPEDLWNLTPKQAAIALAEANRTATHRRQWKLALDDRADITAPESGWLIHGWGSSGCYSYSSHLFALRFGVPDPSLTVFEHNSIGVVGRNPWADQPAHNVRTLKLSENEARFLADTIFWLDRVRSFSSKKNDGFGFGRSSTADGFATISLIPDDGPPRKLAAETVWASSTISGNWEEDYNKTVFVNLAALLIADSFPKKLAERWNIAPEVGHHSLVTPTEERLAPRVDADARQQLTETFSAILEQHAKDPIPAAALEKLAQAAGDEALTGLIPALEQLLNALPPLNDEDEEFAALEKRFERDHFGNALEDKPAEHKKAFARMIELRDQREFLPAAILRPTLTEAIRKLRLAGNTSALMNAVADNAPESRWALTQLRSLDPEAWSTLVITQFKGADIQNRRAIFGTLAAGNPAAVKQLIANLSAAERSDLIVEITRYHMRHEPPSTEGDLALLMTLVRDRKQDYIRRGEAMELLSEAKLPSAMLAEFTHVLVEEIRNPQQGEYGMSTLDSAVSALTELPGAGDHLELITDTPEIAQEAFEAGFQAILHMAKDRPDRNDRLARFLQPRFERSKGMMNDIFMRALATDLRSLSPVIASFASESPTVADGDGANYSGGDFKTPVGQRYHIAREITALWSEQDPLTLGRMWVFFVAAHPYQFNQENGHTELRELAAKHIRALPEAQRRETIESAISLIPIPEHASATGVWLTKQGAN